MTLYKAEALFLQQKYKESSQVLEKSPPGGEGNFNVEHVYLQSSTEQCPKNVLLQQNFVSLELIAGNLANAKQKLEEMTTALGITPVNGKEMPNHLLLTWVYYYIRIGDKKMAAEFLKRRRYLLPLFNSKGSLLKLTY